MIEDRKLTRTVTIRCNNGEYKTVEHVAEVQLRWMSDYCPEVDPNPLGFVNATPWQLIANDTRNLEYERRAALANAVVAEERHRHVAGTKGDIDICDRCGLDLFNEVHERIEPSRFLG